MAGVDWLTKFRNQNPLISLLKLENICVLSHFHLTKPVLITFMKSWKSFIKNPSSDRIHNIDEFWKSTVLSVTKILTGFKSAFPYFTKNVFWKEVWKTGLGITQSMVGSIAKFSHHRLSTGKAYQM